MTADQSATDRSAQFAELGSLLLEAGFSVTDVREELERTRERLTPEHPLSFAVLPEAVLVSSASTPAPSLLRVTTASSLSTRQSAMVSRLMHRLQAGLMSLEHALDVEQHRIRAAAMRRPVLRWTLGNALLSGGLAMLFRCPWWSIVIA